MKKSSFFISAGFVCLLLTCSGIKAQTVKAKKNLEASHIINEAFRTGDISKLDRVIASDFVDHTDRGDMGRDSLKAMIKWMHSQPNDMKMELIREFADDEYVYSHMRFTGTSDGSMGPVGPYDINEIEVIRFNKEGKAVEHWAFMELRQVMKLMSMPPEPTADKKN